MVKLVKQADAFGSLITRDSVSENTLYQLLKFEKYAIIEVNLRAPFYTKEILIDLMQQANFIKFNDDELYIISAFLGSPFHNLEQNILHITENKNSTYLCY
ncbi:hypothetical protein [Lutibacter citreus]|uniref:hypothetical protein n=1 Tax=Lutibacter citreus TaxID=2138210 RepID=UPI001FEA262E|nr:hypothetical protein [Lutibacter citreus]